MRLRDFESMVHRMSAEMPAEFLEGVAEITVSPGTVPHPDRDEIFTLGECIPLPLPDGGSPERIQSRIVLYHGSFLALARLRDGFDWRAEAWETLTHELRHHLEWRARAPDLEAFDRAVEHNFARQDGEPFDPLFYLDGEPAGVGRYRVDDDVFLDTVVDALPSEQRFLWQGCAYRVVLPGGAALPAFLTIEGLPDPPDGDLVLVLRRKPGLRDLVRRPSIYQAVVPAVEVYFPADSTDSPQP